MVVALVLLAAAGGLFASTSMSKGSVQGMLPFASVLAIVALGQTLVIQQGGFDLSVPVRCRSSWSSAPTIRGRQRQTSARRVDGARRRGGGGLVNGMLIKRFRLNPIVATLGTNALL
jgi:ribose transport system permease protein